MIYLEKMSKWKLNENSINEFIRKKYNTTIEEVENR